MPPGNQLRTAAWYGDQPLELQFPGDWDVTVLWPHTPPPLSSDDILEALARPAAGPPVAALCSGKSRPLVIVDDLNRPTPVGCVMPFLLRQLGDAGIPARDVTILMARGSHGAPRREAMLRKIGPEAAANCRFVLHDPSHDTVHVGTTSFGTPVYVNRAVLAADLVIGIGGVYPNHTAGFGGGSKLALGVLDLRVISQLHHRHDSCGWGSPALEAAFRRELDEIAQLIALRFLVTVHVNADRAPIRVRCGDHRVYYREEVAFAREAFCAPLPDGADVVIANAFPNDLSLTFALMKGDYPLRRCGADASRVLLASCSEGVGSHGVYPIVRAPWLHERRDRLRRLSLLTARELAGKLVGRARRLLRPRRSAAPRPDDVPQASRQHRHPIWLYRTTQLSGRLPSTARGAHVVPTWAEVVTAVRQEQGCRERIRVLVYPCAPLQILEDRQGMGVA